MGFQAYEYHHAYTELNLKLTSGIYGSTFFMLTGFHGFHVTMGAIMLSVVLYRVLKRALHAGAPLRVRRRGLVLALRGRGVAGLVRRRVLAVSRRSRIIPAKAGSMEDTKCAARAIPPYG
jgi:hypothetical protein